jgi:N-acetylneuraminate synthase
MKIGNREIGPNYPPLIVAEIGISHWGSLSRCKQLMRACADAGLEAVKLQTHIAEAEMVPEHPWFETVKRCELTEDEERDAFRFAESLGLVCFSTPFSLQAVERLERIGTPAYKIGSGEADWRQLLESVWATGKPTMVSLGIVCGDLAFRVNADTLFMHCVSEYPPRADRWGLAQMVVDLDDYDRGPRNELQYYRGDPFGYSDHTRDPAAVHAAVALGACVVECHVGMHDYEWHTNATPDHLVEWSPDDLGKMNTDARNIWRGMKPVANRGAEVAKLCKRDAQGRRMAG